MVITINVLRLSVEHRSPSVTEQSPEFEEAIRDFKLEAVFEYIIKRRNILAILSFVSHSIKV